MRISPAKGVPARLGVEFLKYVILQIAAYYFGGRISRPARDEEDLRHRIKYAGASVAADCSWAQGKQLSRPSGVPPVSLPSRHAPDQVPIEESVAKMIQSILCVGYRVRCIPDSPPPRPGRAQQHRRTALRRASPSTRGWGTAPTSVHMGIHRLQRDS